MVDIVLLMVSVTLVFVVLLFAVGSIFLDDFRETGPAVITIILGALGTALATSLGAAYATREQREPRPPPDTSDTPEKKKDGDGLGR